MPKIIRFWEVAFWKARLRAVWERGLVCRASELWARGRAWVIVGGLAVPRRMPDIAWGYLVRWEMMVRYAVSTIVVGIVHKVFVTSGGMSDRKDGARCPGPVLTLISEVCS